MERQAVSSKSIRSVGYDQEHKILEIEFDSGQVYEYSDVPARVYADFLAAESHGRYFLENIRDVYAFQKR